MRVDITSQSCTICFHRLPKTEEFFYRNIESPTGYTRQCKECLSLRARKNAEKARKEKMAKYAKEDCRDSAYDGGWMGPDAAYF